MTSTRSSAPGAAAALSPLARLAVIAAFTYAGARVDLASADVTGQQVVAGEVIFNQVGSTTIITASNGSIINYQTFNINPGETVQFIQPGATATVLNHILGPDPSVLAGTLLANGQVYIVNPAGVYFTNGAIVNVAGLYAAAGHISNADFQAGINHFTNLTGSVVNHGNITGSNINLIGQNVANHGNISAPQGTVVMAAGNDVYMYEQGGRVSLRIDGLNVTDQATPHHGSTTPNMNATPGVENTGTVNAAGGNVVLGAGDMYSLAIRNTGSINAGAGNVTVAAASGLVHNTGSISASVGNGAAGNVTVQGPSVLNSGSISADSDNGSAGSVEVTSQNHTYLANGSVISASGGAGNASGGNVLVHSYNGATVFSSGALVDVSGGATGGHGGFVEISGQHLTFNGMVNLAAANGYDFGALLIDPINITINATGGDETFLDDNNIDFSEGPDNMFISAAALEALIGAITLQATGNISVFAAINFDPANNNIFTLQANDNIFINAAISGAQELVFNANFAGGGTGAVHINAPVQAFGNVTMSGHTIFLFPSNAGGTDGDNGILAVDSGGSQNYLNPVIICDDVILSGTEVHFASTVNSNVAGANGLTIDIISGLDGEGGDLGSAQFDGSVGNANELEYLVVNGNSVFGNPETAPEAATGLTVQTLNHQHYLGDVTLNDGVMMASSDSGHIHFGAAVDGAHELAVNTGGLTQFDGVVGGETALLAVVTDAPGTTQIGADMTAGTLAFGDPVTLDAVGEDPTTITLTGTDTVDFAQTVDGNGHSLIVVSPLTHFHASATGFDLLQTDADGITYIGNMSDEEGEGEGEEGGVDGPPAPVLILANQIDMHDHVVLLEDSIFSGNDFDLGAYTPGQWMETGNEYVHLHQTLSGPHHFTVISDGLARFGGNVGEDSEGASSPLASFTALVGDPSVIDQNLIIFDGTLVHTTGDILLNAENGRTTPAQVATIAGTNADGLHLLSDNGSIIMGVNEKMTSLGDLWLQAATEIMVGDLNSVGDMTVDAPLITILLHQGGPILNHLGNLVNDPTVDFIAGGDINFTSTPVLSGVGGAPVFSNPQGSAISASLAGFEHVVYFGWHPGLYEFRDTILDLRPPPILELLQQVTGPNRIEDRILLDPIVSQPLNALAINDRGMSDEEMLATTSGRYLPSDAFTKPPKGDAGDYSVAKNRLRRAAILDALAQHNALFAPQGEAMGDEASNADRVEAVRAAIASSWAAFQAEETAAGNRVDPTNFFQFVQDTPGHEEAFAYLSALRGMAIDLSISGLSGVEYRYSINAVLSPVVPGTMSLQQLKETIGADKLG